MTKPTSSRSESMTPVIFAKFAAIPPCKTVASQCLFKGYFVVICYERSCKEGAE